MKNNFYYVDLKKEFQPLYKNYKEAFLKNHPTADERTCEEYAAKMVRKRARKLFDFNVIQKQIKANAELSNILLLHKSCAERSCNNNYYTFLQDVLLEAKSVFDVGCGLNPGMILSEYPNISQYYCYDKDTKIQKLLQLLNEKYLGNHLTIFLDSEWCKDDHILQIHPDLLLAQKLISNLFYSRNTKMTDRLAAINAKYYLVTGCIHSLSRTISIREDENRALEWFISRYGFQKIRYIETPNEFGWLLVGKNAKIITD